MIKRTFQSRFVPRALATLALCCLAADADLTRTRAQQASGPLVPAGQSATVLADGRTLLIGGEPDRSAVQIRNVDGMMTTLATTPLIPRAWHTATLLSDGSVLIVGGIDARGQVLASPERFLPSTQTFEALPADGFMPRAGQTATLLSDGRVLIVAGRGPSTVRDDADVWDPVSETAQAVGSTLAAPRTGHAAILEADGRVLIRGGTDGAGQPSASDQVFDPTTGTFSMVDMVPLDPNTLYVTFTAPANGALDIPTDVRIAIRFSQSVDLASVSDATVILSGQSGPVPASLIVAEHGRLVFVRPVDPLESSSQYTLAVTGLDAPAGAHISPYTFSFTTRNQASAPVNDGEKWTPTEGNDWKSGQPPSPWQSLAPLSARPMVTALAGQVLRLNGAPLPDVTLTLEGHTARSDRSGRFLIVAEGVATGEHTLAIDGASASHGNKTYGFYEARIGLHAGKTNVLPFTIWSPLIDVQHAVTISSPTVSETVVSTPTMPGLELHLPTGTVIRGEDGSVVRKVTITPIPLDRTPFPLPANATFNMYFTIQPGGAYISTPGPLKGGWLVYPNRTTFKVGTKVPFYNYDPDGIGWYVYGLGTVEKTQVVADPKTRIYGFTGASYDSGPTPSEGGQTPNPKRGEPVDPATGAFGVTKTDLSLPDVMSIALTRVYNAQDSQPRAFGIGMRSTYDLFQYTTDAFNNGDLILPDGDRIHYVRISASGLPWYQTVFECQSAPTVFYKSRETFDGPVLGGSWDYTLKDGTVYVMGHESELQAIRDRYGNQTTLTYAQTNTFGYGTGNLIRITSPNGRWIEFTYDSATPVNHVVQAKDNIGRIVGYAYDANGRLSTVTDPENNVTTYTWDTSNRLVSIKDGRNITYLTNQYDASNRVTQQTLADPNAKYGFAYTTDGSGNITQTAVTDPRGHVEQLSFNADHYLMTDVEAVGQPETRTTTIERQAGSDLPTAVVDGMSRRTEYTYDSSGHMLTVTRLAGTSDAVSTTFTYEPKFFQLSTITDPLTHTWTFGYDTSGNLTSVSDPLGHQTTVAQNTVGQVTSVADPLQHIWQFAYTGADETSVTSPVGSVWHRTLDAAGRVLSTTDPLGHVTRRIYDKVNQLTSAIDPLGGQTSFQYDPNGRLLSLSDALSHATSYTYDASDRTATRTDPLLNAVRYAYDLKDNLTQTTDRKGLITSYQYDALDRLTLVTFADTSTTQYTYDAGDRVTQIADSIAGTVTRGYDDLDRLTLETTPEGIVSYTYDADGRRLTMTVAGQAQITYDYDDAHRLASIAQGTNVASFTYDAADRRQTLTLPNGIVTTYGYDSANELTSLSYTHGSTALGTLTYAYDLAGNRTSIGGSWARSGLPQPLTSATYDAGNRIQTWAGQTFSYDANGNLGSDGLTSYTWSARNALVGLSGATSAVFAYDGLGRRRSKTIGGSTVNFLYDGVNIVQELSSGSPTANLLTGGGIDETLTRADAGGTSSFLTDALGSTMELADTSGALQTHYSFEPFGATAPSGATSANAQQFTGRENDGTALLFYRARYYDPNLGRFISEDPLELLGGGVNFYAYAWNSPTNWDDPLGLHPGDKYPNVRCAGWHAIQDINPTSRQPTPDYPHGREYGGWVYQNSDGTYSYVEPVPGGAAGVRVGDYNPIPAGATAAGMYHTHGGYDPYYNQGNPSPGQPGYDWHHDGNEVMSPPDRNSVDRRNIPGYLGTPQGTTEEYTHGHVVVLTGRNCGCGK